MIVGRYFFANSARFVPARASVDDKRILKITGEDGGSLAEAPLRQVKITPRLADLPRKLMLPDGACFETLDNDGVDELIGIARHLVSGGWMDRLERSWRAIVVSIILASAAVGAFVVWGIPALAFQLAMKTPDWMAAAVSDQTMTVLDSHYIQATEISEADQAKAMRIFEQVAKTGACAPHVCRLLFRSRLGANAFALPDGRIVMTDAMWQMAKPEELAGVFAHEMAHVRLAHGLQRVYEASLVPALIVVVTGDISQIGQMAVILPGVLVQSAYSREFETEADRSALTTLRKLGINPAVMAGLLERMDRERCGDRPCGGSWLGDHPDTAFRAALYRSGR